MKSLALKAFLAFRYGLIALVFSYLFLLSFSVLAPPVYDALMTRPVMTFDALKSRRAFEEQAYVPWFFYPARDDRKGVVTNDPAKAFDGYTLFTDTHGQQAQLIAMDGTIVHRWQKEFSDVWPDLDLPRLPPPEKRYWGRVFLEPNGDLYVMHLIEGPPEKPFGVTRLDKDSNVLWSSPVNAHHDIALLEDGSYYTFSATASYTANPYIPYVRPPYSEETIARFDPQGTLIESYSLIDMIYHSDAKPLLDLINRIPSDPKLNAGDLFHPNTITVIPPGLEDKAPMLKAGQVLVSFRNINLLTIFDLQARKATWASYGPFRGQHSPVILPDGSVLLFDNEGNLDAETGASRALRVDLNTMAMLWEYDGTKENPLYSPYNGFVQPLPNGNVLITESHAGRILEVTPDKEIVWEYIIPERLEANGVSRIPSVFSGFRFAREDLPFLKGDQPIEAPAP